jgi:hypothetical protein
MPAIIWYMDGEEYVAYILGSPDCGESRGSTLEEAIGKLVISNGSELDIHVQGG